MSNHTRFDALPFDGYLNFDELEQWPGEAELNRYQRPVRRGRPVAMRAPARGQRPARPRRQAAHSAICSCARCRRPIFAPSRFAFPIEILSWADGDAGQPASVAFSPPAGRTLAQAGDEPALQYGDEPALQGNSEPTATTTDEQGELPPWPRGGREHIRWIQDALNKILGLRLAVDGLLGPATRTALRTFQQRQGLTVDGIVGSQTEAALAASVSGGRASGTRPGQPCEVLSGFDFDRDMLKPQHQRQIEAIALRIATNKIGGVRVVGYTDPVVNIQNSAEG